MYELRLLGTPRLEGAVLPSSRVTRPRPMGLLSILAAAGNQGVTRDRAAALLWDEASDCQARHHLSDALYVLHHELGADAVDAAQSVLVLNTAVVRTDLVRFREAIGRTNWAAAAAEYGGPFLDGFYVTGASSFEEWSARERSGLAQLYATALEALAEAAATTGDWKSATKWWRALLEHDRYNSRAAMALARVLAENGDRGNAVEILDEHCRLLREDLGMDAGSEVRAMTVDVRNGGVRAKPITMSAAPAVLAEAESDVADARPADGGPVDHARAGGRRRWARLAMTLLPVLALAIVAWLVLRPNMAPALDAQLIAVPPFRAMTTNPAIRRLALDAPDLIWAAITGEFGLRVADPAAIEARWRRAGGDAGRPVNTAAAIELARASGAGLLVLGTVAGTDTYVRLGASVLDVPTGAVRVLPVAVEGEYVRFPALVDQLINEILAREAFVPEHRLPELARHPSPAVQAYLSGVRAQRPIAWKNDWLLRALELDSTLLLAAVAQYQAGEADQGLARLIWRERATLPRKDALLAVPLVGWRFGSSRTYAERIVQYEELVRAGSEWSSPLEEWASTLYAFGRAAGRERTDLAAGRALQRVVRWNPDHLASWYRLFSIALFAEDSGSVRRFARTYRERSARLSLDTGIGWLLTWTLRLRLALFEADTAEVARLWRQEDDALRVMLDQPLQWSPVYGSELAPLVGGLLADGRGLTELDAFVPRLLATSTHPSFPALNWARARGHRVEWLSIRDALYAQLPPVTAAGLRVRDALFLGEPEESAEAAAAFLERVARGAIVPPADPTDPSPDAVGPARARCWSALWAQAHGRTEGIGDAIRWLRDAPLPYRYAVCAELLEVLLTVREGGEARAAVRRLDDLVRTFPMEGWPFERGVRDLTLGVDNLIVARLLAQYGDTVRALAAIRRGPWGPVAIERAPHWSLGLLPEFVLEEGRLAAATGDTTGAIRALRHYAALRAGTAVAHEEWLEAGRLLDVLVGKTR